MGILKIPTNGSSAKPDITTYHWGPQMQPAATLSSMQVHNLKANDTGAQHIGEAGQQLINTVLTPSNVRLYW